MAVERHDKQAYQDVHADTKTGCEDCKKTIVHLDCFLVGLAKIVGKNVFSLLMKINREQCQHDIELASAEETTSKQRLCF